VERRKLPPDSRLSRLEGLPPSFLSYCNHLRRLDRSPRSLETYADCLKTFALWLVDEEIGDPAKATAGDLARFQVWLCTTYRYRGRTVSVGRQAVYATVVREFFRYLAQEGLTLSNPASRLRVPKVPKQLKGDALSADELTALLKIPDDSPRGMRDCAALRLLAFCGPRTQELVGVDVDDLALRDRELVIRKGKGRKERLTFFDRSTQAHLARYLVQGRPHIALADERALLVNDFGWRISPFVLGRIVRRHAEAAGIARRLSCISMRRTFCSLLLSGGANLKAIAELAGHENLDTTTRYARLTISELKRVYHFAHPRSGRRP
jgi:site-specific recombinase XerD